MTGNQQYDPMVTGAPDRPASNPPASQEWKPSVPTEEVQRQGGVLPGEEIIEALRMLHQTTLRKKEELSRELESREREIDEGVHSVQGETSTHGTPGDKTTFERLRNELYQTYLKKLGGLIEETTGNVLSMLRSLPGPTFEMTILLHEFEETIRELDRTRRKCAMEIKRRLDEKRSTGLENRLRQASAELGMANERNREMELEIEELTRTLAMNRAEFKRRFISEDEWKESYARELRKQILHEVRETLEREIRGDMEKRIRAELENELRGRALNGNRVKQVKTSSSSLETHGPVPPGPERNEPAPFVRCPVCTERIEILSPERPQNVQCPGCGSGYTIRDRQRDGTIPAIHGGRDPGSGMGRSSDPDPYREPGDGYHTPAQPSAYRRDGATGYGSSQEKWSDVEDLLPSPPDYNGTEIPKSAARSSPFNTDETHRIECPYCGRAHMVPAGLTQRLTCACGRRIRTE